MTPLTKYWCEEAYKQKYGVIYPWSGREAKALQKLLRWVDANFPDEGEAKVRSIMDTYLKSTSKESHPFTWMANEPQKWIRTNALTVEAVKRAFGLVRESCRYCDESGFVIWEREAYACRCSNGEKIKARKVPEEGCRVPATPFMDRVLARDPLVMFKGFCQTGWRLKATHPEDYQAARAYFLEALGEKECKTLWARYAGKKLLDMAKGNK